MILTNNFACYAVCKINWVNQTNLCTSDFIFIENKNKRSNILW